MAFSIGAATVCSITSAEAPGYTACTVTTGGAMSGYCAMGRLRIAARPASTMKMDSTAAKIGRSMKNLENMGRVLLLLFVRLRFCFRLGAGLGDAHRRSRPEAHQALDDHAIAGLHALVDDPGIARPFADLDRPRLSGVFFVDDVDELALRSFHHRALWHRKRVRARRAAQDHADELAWTEHALGVRQLGTRLARTGGRRDAHVGEVELAG